MKLWWIFFLLFQAISTYGQKPVKKNVLFVGNSLTYYAGMPEYLRAMLLATNQPINIEVSAYPGMSLASHLRDMIVSRTQDGINTRPKQSGEQTLTETMLLSRQWDIIILQEAPVRILIPEVRKYSTQQSIQQIKQRIANPHCHFVLFQTWAPNGTFPAQFCYPAFLLNRATDKESYCSDQMKNLDEEYKLLKMGYDSVCISTQVDMVDINRIYYKALKEQPSIKLFDQDSHPTKLGAYLNAYLFYKFLVDRHLSSLAYYGDLAKEDALLLQKLSD
ncbi:DUF4886 domain-containing protein [Fibrella forsythiae]|uniref:DUF4886 domain-containing protein n=1 Tax=Fibrella forsythiae TaxID=2817061 RepID=A0ABS3JGQ6_9BACT|nr:DUF4886 domain-containing protein [Fibrella forsythiae]MBO0949193.1 hypothetical protein [Fibrella forsythiae]